MPFCAQDRPKTSPRCPKTAPRCPKTTPRPPQERNPQKNRRMGQKKRPPGPHAHAYAHARNAPRNLSEQGTGSALQVEKHMSRCLFPALRFLLLFAYLCFSLLHFAAFCCSTVSLLSCAAVFLQKRPPNSPKNPQGPLKVEVYEKSRDPGLNHDREWLGGESKYENEELYFLSLFSCTLCL